MKMVIGQLEGILRELKEVAKELREVVSQIDKLTSDFDFELEPDDWTTATVSSTSSSDKAGVGGPFDLGHLDFMTADILSDSWEFCSFLDVSTPSDSVDGPEAPRPGTGPDYQLMNGGLPIPNGPRVETPDSSSEEAFSPGPRAAPRGATHRPPQALPSPLQDQALSVDHPTLGPHVGPRTDPEGHKEQQHSDSIRQEHADSAALYGHQTES